MNHDIDKIRKNPKLEGQNRRKTLFGKDHLAKKVFQWELGSSSGITPMQVSKYPCSYDAMPISQRAKVYK